MGKANSGNNRSNQMNPNNDAYWQGRGFPSRPKDWRQQVSRSAHEGRGGTAKGGGTKK